MLFKMPLKYNSLLFPQSYDKQSYHSGTPPPFNIAGTQNAGGTSGQAYGGQQLYITHTMPTGHHNMNMHQPIHQVSTKCPSFNLEPIRCSLSFTSITFYTIRIGRVIAYPNIFISLMIIQFIVLQLTDRCNILEFVLYLFSIVDVNVCVYVFLFRILNGV